MTQEPFGPRGSIFSFTGMPGVRYSDWLSLPSFLNFLGFAVGAAIFGRCRVYCTSAVPLGDHAQKFLSRNFIFACHWSGHCRLQQHLETVQLARPHAKESTNLESPDRLRSPVDFSRPYRVNPSHGEEYCGTGTAYHLSVPCLLKAQVLKSDRFPPPQAKSA